MTLRLIADELSAPDHPSHRKEEIHREGDAVRSEHAPWRVLMAGILRKLAAKRCAGY